MYIENVLDLLFQLMKNGTENKSLAFIFLFILLKLTVFLKETFLCQVLVNFYRGAIESILTGNITNWHGMCRAEGWMNSLDVAW